MKTLFINHQNRYRKTRESRQARQQLAAGSREVLAVLGNTLGLGVILVLIYLVATGTVDLVQKVSGL